MTRRLGVNAAIADGHRAGALDSLWRCRQAAAVFILAAGSRGRNSAATDGQRAVSLDALAAGAGRFESQRTATDGHIVVGLQASGTFSILVRAVVSTGSRCGHRDGAARDGHVARSVVAVALDTLGCLTAHGHVDSSTINGYHTGLDALGRCKVGRARACQRTAVGDGQRAGAALC